MARNDFSLMVSVILLITVVFGILLTTGESKTGATVVEQIELSELDKDEIDICKGAGGKPIIVHDFSNQNDIAIKCDLSEFDNRLL